MQNLDSVMPYIRHLPLRRVHMGTLDGFINVQREKGIKRGTVNRQLAVAKRILKLCSGRYRDEHGCTPSELVGHIKDIG